MNIKTWLCGLLATGFMCAAAAPASAAIVTYTLTGRGSGEVDTAFGSTPFHNTAFTITLEGDTSGAFSIPGAFSFVPVFSAEITALGKTREIAVGANALFASVPILAPGVAFFGAVTGGGLTPDGLFFNPALATYDGTYGIGPLAIVFDPTELPILILKKGGEIDFSDIRKATFSAFVPEPATWTLTIVGCAGLGLMLRRSRHALAKA